MGKFSKSQFPAVSEPQGYRDVCRCVDVVVYISVLVMKYVNVHVKMFNSLSTDTGMRKLVVVISHYLFSTSSILWRVCLHVEKIISDMIF